MLAEIIFYIFIFLFGIVIGSFLNVCIYRIPKHEDIVKTRSHCMSCGYQLKWYDMFPVFSYLFLRGRCRKCHAKLSVQYPLIEAANGIGMTKWQRLWQVELPNAWPVMLSGIRIATAINVGTAPLAFLIGASSYGELIFPGIYLNDFPTLILGATATHTA